MAVRKIAPKDFELEGSFAPIVFSKLPTGASFSGFSKDALDKVFIDLGIDPKLGLKDLSMPISLRWRTSINLGIPLTVFNVWRKSRTDRTNNTIAVDMQITSSGIQFNNGPFVKVNGSIHNKSNLDFTVNLYPKNSDLQNYASKDFSFFINAGASIAFTVDQPNMYGLESSNPGQIEFSALNGISVNDYINDKDWELIQKVGLPAEKGYIDNNLYNYEEQGFINALQPPTEAAITRLTLQKMFYIDSPVMASDGAAMPVWQIPDPKKLVKSYYLTAPINNGVTGMLNDIREMFDKVYNVSPALYIGQQKRYTKTIQGFGIYDEANSSPKKNGTYLHPVCAATLLSTSSDSWNALGLGFGTTDLVPYGNYANPKNYILGPYDYMVTAQFRQPITELFIDNVFSVKEKLAGIDVVEYAALCSYDIALPIAPPSLLAEPMLENRPLRMDDYYYQQERVSWLHQAIQKKHPLVFSILFYNAITGSIRYLNQARPFLPSNPQPLLPAARSDAAAADEIGRDSLLYDKFIHDKAPLPFVGSVNHKYYVAAQDVFGVWSKWSDCVQNLAAKPPQRPDIIAAKFINLLQAVNPAINQATLEIIFNWHWDDRSPFEIRFTGHFFAPPVPYADPAPWAMPGIAMGNGLVKRYAVRFGVSGAPSLFEIKPFNVYQPVPMAEAEVIDENSFVTGNGNGSPHTGVDDTRTYKLSLYQMQLNFTSTSKLYYSIEALGIEAVNPTVESSSTLPYVINTVDPNPKVPPVFVTDIKWASLPDVDNVSRYHLKFPAIPGAVGYAIYRATETSLRAKFVDLQNYPEQGNIFQRRNVLELASVPDKKRGLDAFIRVNKELLKSSINGVELEMNGDVGGLYIYAVSSFSEQNVESKLSNWIYVAVPQRITPGIPTLTGYINKKLATPKLVLKVKVGPGDNTDAVQLYKTAKTNLARDLNIMGLPVSIGPGNAGWTKYKSALPVDIVVSDPAGKYDYLLFEEDLQPTWQTIFLRTASMGKNSPSDGLFPGRSASSNLLELIPPIPAALAQIINAAIVPTATTLQLSFKTNAFTGSSNYGNHVITILQRDINGIFKEIIKQDIPVIPKISSGSAETINQLYRLEKDNSDFSLYHFNIAQVDKVDIQIKITDPAGRNTIQVIGYEKPPVPTNIVIKDVKVKIQLANVLIEFKTNVSKLAPLPPLQGTFLTVAVKPKLGALKTFVRTEFHLIPDKLALSQSGIYGGRLKDVDGFYTYDILLRTSADGLAVKNGKSLSITITPFKKAAVVSNTKL